MGRLLELSTPVASILLSSQTAGISIVYIVGICCSLPKSAFSTYSDSAANISYLKIHDSRQGVLLKKVEGSSLDRTCSLWSVIFSRNTQMYGKIWER